jgi:hypothetical protein
MPALRAIYARGHSLTSWAIRNADTGRQARWSHCGVVTPEGTVIEARLFKGVVETAMADFLKRYSKTEQVDIECPDPAAGLEFARCLLGWGYDYLGALGNFFRADWHQAWRLHCAHALELIVIAAGRERFRDEPWFVRPNQSYMVT